MSRQIVKVSQLVRYLKSKLDSDSAIQRILVQGEISNFKAQRSGHWYFSLKDETARISCVMFATYTARMKFLPKDGDKVIVQADISVYEAAGQMQMYVTAMKPDGLGDLFLQYEELKKKLAQAETVASDKLNENEIREAMQNLEQQSDDDSDE